MHLLLWHLLLLHLLLRRNLYIGSRWLLLSKLISWRHSWSYLANPSWLWRWLLLHLLFLLSRWFLKLLLLLLQFSLIILIILSIYLLHGWRSNKLFLLALLGLSWCSYLFILLFHFGRIEYFSFLSLVLLLIR